MNALCQCDRAVFHQHRPMRRSAQLPHGFNDLCHTAAVGRMVVAKPAAIGVEGQFADAGD